MNATPGGSSSCSEGRKAGPFQKVKIGPDEQYDARTFPSARTRWQMEIMYDAGRSMSRLLFELHSLFHTLH